MPRLVLDLRLPAILLTVLLLSVSGFDAASAAIHPDDHVHHGAGDAEDPGIQPGHEQCHGVLLCHSAAFQPAAHVPHLGSTTRLRHWRLVDILPHLTHHGFDPPPPRGFV